MSNPPSLIIAAATLQLVLMAALVAQWRQGRRSRERLVRLQVSADERARALVHELNQPLTAILSNAQAAQRFLAAEPVDLQELREILDDIVMDDKRAAGIVQRIGGVLQEAPGSRAVQSATDGQHHGENSGTGTERAQ